MYKDFRLDDIVPLEHPLSNQNLREGPLQQRDERSIAYQSLASARLAHALEGYSIYEERQQKSMQCFKNRKTSVA